jgi:hypothetical protein
MVTDQKQNTYLSTWLKKVSATSESSATMHSVWALQKHQVKQQRPFRHNKICDNDNKNENNSKGSNMPSMFIYVVNGSKDVLYNFNCASKWAVFMM